MASQSDARSAPSGSFGNPVLEEVAAGDSGEHPVGHSDGIGARQPLTSGAFPSAGARSDEPAFAALAPYYEAHDEESEHAVLDIADPIIGQRTALSASSLVPAPSEPFPIGRTVAAIGVLALAAAAGALLWSRSPEPQPVEVAVVEVMPVVAANNTAVPAVAVAVDPPAAPDSLPPAAQEAASSEAAQAPVASPAQEAARLKRRELRHARRAAAEAEGAVAAPAVADAPSGQPAEPKEPEANDVAALTLPTTPTREQIAAGFNAVIPQLKECAAGAQGLGSAKVTIGASGAVRYAVVGGAFQGTPAGSCMARALRGATFPEFARKSISVEYPFSL